MERFVLHENAGLSGKLHVFSQIGGLSLTFLGRNGVNVFNRAESKVKLCETIGIINWHVHAANVML